MQLRLDGKPIDDVAIDVLRYHEADALRMHPDGYWLAHSGGKDSIVIHDLAKRSGVKHEAVHNVTGIDPVEIYRFLREHCPDVRLNPLKKSLWSLIRENGMPPLRNRRYCCRHLKERGGEGRVVITGIRDAESSRRSKRRMYEPCFRGKGRMYLNVIKAWTTQQVWQYIREHELPYCSLYDEGFKRIGCVLCPMTRNVEQQITRWPRLARAWERAIKATYRPAAAAHGFADAEEYWQWWLDRDRPAMGDDDPVLFEDDPALFETEADQ